MCEMTKQEAGKLEWRIKVPDGTSVPVLQEEGAASSLGKFLSKLLGGIIATVVRFLERAWKMGVSEPKKVIHCMKVGVALTLVSLFYYTRPLYDGVGGNAMWAVMTVVVVFEYTVGATLYKCINRTTGTFLAGSLGLGVHWAAHQSGTTFEPIILGLSVFLLASAATFSRFIPSIKARFDYGAMIFILTFSLVSVSGYRVDKLIDMAHQRLSTIAIGVSLCIMISMFICPVWAGNELHQLILRNMDKLAISLEGFVDEYFKEGEREEENSTNLTSYKCILNSKATEETMANFARWEPAHGHFGFRHPWREYTKIGALMRSCAFCIETLYACVNSEIWVDRKNSHHVSNACMMLCLRSSNVLKELAGCLKSMTKSSKLTFLIADMNIASQELQDAMNSLPSQLVVNRPCLMDLIPLATMMSLLTEISSRIEDLANGIVEFAKLAEFKAPRNDRTTAKVQPVDVDVRVDDETSKDIPRS
ncbi:hypothetical protein MLD38_036327 [Melastoma candidum]|uniref:Uncharacterized protein n=1 Tax=Melastoma candidum TaxID=119954 RepID=A0ACB9LJL1_9MYRT|nr:hypothetical protein MLD38_036327 [Melastoma candidum]